ncbi:hypothetical protein ISG33_08795 [Glaciecola sp. MH2013]|uniref:hypothetical protein n=1 Tax=Glaciecola sp. MH2013 TaxID=2785524 RepID=UPI00189D3FC0|nr:hypothetical protein [Glaciecola sp. MH2013]MBF7073490.1 hypothetical protein [Glaciecola sp. MH2013]
MDKQVRMEVRRQTGTRKIPEKTKKTEGPEYSMSFVCLICKTSNMRHFNRLPRDYPDVISCPICKGDSFNLGRNFKPPKKSDSMQWKKIKYLVSHGFLFQKIRVVPGSNDSIPYPETLSEAKDFVANYGKWAIKRLKKE